MRMTICFLAAAISFGAAAHTNEILSKRTGPHGGQMRVAAQYHVELALADGEIDAWVTDHADQPQPTAGARAQAIVTFGRERVVVDLAPAGANGLRTRDERLRADKTARIAFNLTMAGQAPVQARFAPAPAAKSAAPANVTGAHAH